MSRCNICNDYSTSNICERCLLTLRQIDTILSIYLEENEVPEWLINFLPEIDFLFDRDSRARVFFNASKQLRDIVLIENPNKIWPEHLTELNYSQIPQNRVLSILEKAMLLKKVKDYYEPGILLNRLLDIRLYGYEFDSIELQSSHKQINAIICVALIKALIEDFETYIPKGALAVFNMLSQHMIMYESTEISNIISKNTISKSFRIVSNRHFNHIKYTMGGISDGRTRIIRDLTEDYDLVCKDNVVIYLERIRERMREREDRYRTL